LGGQFHEDQNLMARTLHADGTTGKVYIYKGDAAPSTYETPTGPQLGELHFHSDLSYLGNAQVIDVTLTHPERTRSSSTSKGLFGSTTYYNPRQGTENYTLASHGFGRVVPFVSFYGSAQLPAGTVVQQAGESARAVSIFVTSTAVQLFENWVTFDDTLPAISRNYRVFMFETLFSGAGNESIRIEPTLFRAGFGKLDTAYRYVRESGAPDFYVTAAKTADVQGGGLRVVLPNGVTQINTSTYTGSFAGSPGRGVQI
jgi:hypothetical protein